LIKSKGSEEVASYKEMRTVGGTSQAVDQGHRPIPNVTKI